jgi:hypothetical protein
VEGIIMKKEQLTKIASFILALLLITSVSAQNADEQAQAGDADVPQTQPSDIGGDWRTEDFQPYIKTIDDLKKLSKEFSEKILQQSIDEYSTGMDILRDMDANLSEMDKNYVKQNNLNERWYWQEIDRANQHKRRKSLLKYESN